MHRPASTALNACTRVLLAAGLVLAAACSDGNGTQSSTNNANNNGGQDVVVNLGDTKAGDTTKVDTGTNDVQTPDDQGSQSGGCKTDADCTGKVNVGSCQVAQCDVSSGTCQTATAPDGTNCQSADMCYSQAVCTAGTCNGTVKANCDDNNPCTDETCDSTNGCQYTNNGKPCDDGDPTTTGDLCVAGVCKGGSGTCANTKEINCSDGKDDDCDGAIDCADNDCATDPKCAIGKTETDCANNIDDDGDGQTDCKDSDCATFPACAAIPAKETNCANGVDDDKDGATDCADNDCAADAACANPTKEANCTNGIDDDKDGATDCKDNDCAADAACNANGEVNCTNGIDDDKDGLTDCADNDCAVNAACAVTVETNCGNLVDDDKDGKTDCNDSDCAKDAKCLAPKTETNCTDKIDNDLDGLVDCNDADCAADAACKATCNVCAAAAGGKPLDPACDPCAAKVCGTKDASGNWSGDGYCCDTAWDAVCVKEVFAACGKQCEADCANKKDDDGDGNTDCADDDCTKAAACNVPVATCQSAGSHICGDSVKGNNGDAGSSKALDSYTCKDGNANQETGPEMVYDVTAECDGAMTISLQKIGTASGYLDLFVLDGSKACAANTCIAHNLMGTDAATVTLKDAKKGTKYLVVVDGYANLATDFTLKIQCGCAGGKETICNDTIDNDADGLTDCKDSDCAADLACTPTVETNCTDKVDNDKDGKTDCGDSDCAKDPACVAPSTEANCTDKIDNDKDGKTDCNDSDCAKDPACAPTSTETLCSDKIDNDKDGKIDCADSDCAADAACSCKASYTLKSGVADNWNNGGNGSTQVVNTWTCTDGSAGNETGPELTYSYTADCTGDLTVTLTKTGSASEFIDLFLLDGTKPCAANTCVAHALMSNNAATKTVSVKKGDKYLFAVDGYNAVKSDYTIKAVCAGKETLCADKIDNDGDGKTDCDDSDCAADAACKVTTETKCADQIDNDQDGKTDCSDSDCAKDPACVISKESICDDKVDNDKDGKTDCADSDCAANPVCQCSGDFPLTCGGTDSYGNASAGSTDIVDSYTCKDGSFGNETGSEYTYTYLGECDGDVTVTLTKTSTAAGFLDLFVLDGSQVCAGSSCVAHGLMGGKTATVKFAGKKGAKYDIVVDGYNNYSGQYDIKIDCGCTPIPATEAICNDGIDNDKDGTTDCADSDCAADASCAAGCVGDFPMSCGSSDQYTSDSTGSTDKVDTYVCPANTYGTETGNEYTYDFTASCTGAITVTLTKVSTTPGYLDLFVLDGSKICDGKTCLAGGLMMNSTVAVTFNAVKDSKYLFVVDGYDGYAGDYKLDTACACK